MFLALNRYQEVGCAWLARNLRNPFSCSDFRPFAWASRIASYWVVDQAEFSTDLFFTSREALAGLYPRLLDHAAVNFSAKDILTFLGRRFHPRFDGEVLTHCQKGRWPGARIKHRMKNNWLKMYDKFGWSCGSRR